MTITQAKHALTVAKSIQDDVNRILRPQEQPELMTVSEVARIFRVDDTTIRRWINQGALEAVILPHVNERQAYRIRRETVEKLLGK